MSSKEQRAVPKGIKECSKETNTCFLDEGRGHCMKETVPGKSTKDKSYEKASKKISTIPE